MTMSDKSVPSAMIICKYSTFPGLLGCYHVSKDCCIARANIPHRKTKYLRCDPASAKVFSVKTTDAIDTTEWSDQDFTLGSLAGPTSRTSTEIQDGCRSYSSPCAFNQLTMISRSSPVHHCRRSISLSRVRRSSSSEIGLPCGDKRTVCS